MAKTAKAFKDSGNIKFKAKQFAAAIKDYDQAIKLNPAFKEAWYNKGVCYKKLFQYGEALKAFDEAIKLDRYYVKALKNRLQCHDAYAAKVFLFVVDLKLTKDNQVKILEFGRGVQSAFNGYAAVEGREADVEILTALEQLGLPVYLGDPMGFMSKSRDSLEAELAENIDWPPAKSRFNYNELKSFRGLYGGFETFSVSPDILKLDDSAKATLLMDDKCLMHKMFKLLLHGLHYRPKTIICDRKNVSQLSIEIKRSLPSKRYVLKPPDMNRGDGIIVTNQDELSTDLDSLQYNRSWLSSQSANFLVEECVPSKPLRVNGKLYDPTMRVTFMVCRDQGVMRFIPVCSYWKLPRYALGERGVPLQEKLISVCVDGRLSSAKVSDDDKASVYKQLEAVIPKLFEKILNIDIYDFIKSKGVSVDNKQYLLNFLAAIYRGSGETALAVHANDRAIKLNADAFIAYYEKGLAYYQNKQFKKSIEAFSEAVKRSSNPEIHFRIGLAYEKMKDIKLAAINFKRAKKFGFDEIKINKQLMQLSKDEREILLSSLLKPLEDADGASAFSFCNIAHELNENANMLVAIADRGAKHKDALCMVEVAIKLSSLFKDKHSVMRYKTNKATILSRAGNLDKAEEVMTDAINDCKALHPASEFDPAFSDLYFNMAYLLERAKKYKKAKLFINKVVVIDEARYGKNSPQLGEVYELQNSLAEIIAVAQKPVATRTSSSGEPAVSEEGASVFATSSFFFSSKAPSSTGLQNPPEPML